MRNAHIECSTIKSHNGQFDVGTVQERAREKFPFIMHCLHKHKCHHRKYTLHTYARTHTWYTTVIGRPWWDFAVRTATTATITFLRIVTYMDYAGKTSNVLLLWFFVAFSLGSFSFKEENRPKFGKNCSWENRWSWCKMWNEQKRSRKKNNSTEKHTSWSEMELVYGRLYSITARCYAILHKCLRIDGWKAE